MAGCQALRSDSLDGYQTQPQKSAKDEEYHRQEAKQQGRSPERREARDLCGLGLVISVAHGHHVSDTPCLAAVGHAGFKTTSRPEEVRNCTFG